MKYAPWLSVWTVIAVLILLGGETVTHRFTVHMGGLGDLLGGALLVGVLLFVLALVWDSARSDDYEPKTDP